MLALKVKFLHSNCLLMLYYQKSSKFYLSRFIPGHCCYEEHPRKAMGEDCGLDHSRRLPGIYCLFCVLQWSLQRLPRDRLAGMLSLSTDWLTDVYNTRSINECESEEPFLHFFKIFLLCESSKCNKFLFQSKGFSANVCIHKCLIQVVLFSFIFHFSLLFYFTIQCSHFVVQPLLIAQRRFCYFNEEKLRFYTHTSLNAIHVLVMS